MRSEYGQEVICEVTGGPEPTHRPAGGGGPWFCMVCGATTNHPAGNKPAPKGGE